MSKAVGAEALTLSQSQELSMAYFTNPVVFDVVIDFVASHPNEQQNLVDQLASHDRAASELTLARSEYEAAHQAARLPFDIEPPANKDELEAEHRAKGVASMHAKAALSAEKTKVTHVGDELSVAIAGFCAARTQTTSITLLGRTYDWADGFIVEHRGSKQIPYGTIERHVAYKMHRLRDLTPKQAASVHIGTVGLPDWRGLLHRLDLVTRFAIL